MTRIGRILKWALVSIAVVSVALLAFRSYGSTAPAEVAAQLARWKAELG